MEEYKYQELTQKIISQCYYVHNKLGCGFLEKVYERALVKKLLDLKLDVKSQYPIRISFEGEIIGDYIADIIAENKVIIEVKAIEKLTKIHEVQIINYLKATNIEVGLLVNFGEKIEIKRKILTKNSENP